MVEAQPSPKDHDISPRTTGTVRDANLLDAGSRPPPPASRLILDFPPLLNAPTDSTLATQTHVSCLISLTPAPTTDYSSRLIPGFPPLLNAPADSMLVT
ncbi:hypothetical protein C8J55DRAFT_567510 [Lentinula edodes]|uniref:Uncharacterized protein n=1 Tax=Lentinula lateritia TaxID=40482 RepID=A0A9W8ZPG2_9AGAR|nr:hypothetical protein C8J55DRAFT_567510 [Lentinula edodes]